MKWSSDAFHLRIKIIGYAGRKDTYAKNHLYLVDGNNNYNKSCFATTVCVRWRITIITPWINFEVENCSPLFWSGLIWLLLSSERIYSSLFKINLNYCAYAVLRRYDNSIVFQYHERIVLIRLLLYILITITEVYYSFIMYC